MAYDLVVKENISIYDIPGFDLDCMVPSVASDAVACFGCRDALLT